MLFFLESSPGPAPLLRAPWASPQSQGISCHVRVWMSTCLSSASAPPRPAPPGHIATTCSSWCCALTTCTPDCMLDGGHLIQSVQPCLPAPSPWSGSPWRPRIILSTSERGKPKLRKGSEWSNSKNSDRLALKPALLPRVVCVKLQQRRDSPQTLIPRTFRPSPCPRGHQSRSASALCPTPSFLALAHQGRRKGWCYNGQRQLPA